MSTDKDIHDKLREMGLAKNKNPNFLGLEITVCQFVVVALSLLSLFFLFLPIVFLKNIILLGIFFVLSLVSLGIGIWFWVKKAEICEHPEEYD